jgi:microcystin-dependent protein
MAAAATVPNSFTAATLAESAKVNANFTSLLTWINTNAAHLDGSQAFTGVPSGPATDPTSANQFTRKAYVDNVVPAGVVVDYAGASAPSGWVFCDGTLYDGTNPTYARLFAAIGLTYGGSASNFNVPDYRGRVTVGKAASGTFLTLGAAGGAETHTLVTGEIPSHVHDGSHNHTASASSSSSSTTTISDPGHFHSTPNHDHAIQRSGAYGVAAAGGTVSSYYVQQDSGSGFNVPSPTLARTQVEGGGLSTSTVGTGITAGTSTSTSTSVTVVAASFNVGAQGGGGAHNNLQPYRVANKIIKL